jgi:hypothetical protein
LSSLIIFIRKEQDNNNKVEYNEGKFPSRSRLNSAAIVYLSGKCGKKYTLNCPIIDRRIKNKVIQGSNCAIFFWRNQKRQLHLEQKIEIVFIREYKSWCHDFLD